MCSRRNRFHLERSSDHIDHMADELVRPHRSPWCSRSRRSPQWSTGSISGQVVPRSPRRPELFEVDADGGGVVELGARLVDSGNPAVDDGCSPRQPIVESEGMAAERVISPLRRGGQGSCSWGGDHGNHGRDWDGLPRSVFVEFG